MSDGYGGSRRSGNGFMTMDEMRAVATDEEGRENQSTLCMLISWQIFLVALIISIVVLIITYFVWGMITLMYVEGIFEATGCAEKYPIYPIAAMGLLYYPFALIIMFFIDPAYKMVILRAGLWFGGFFAAVWGAVIWFAINDVCEKAFTQNFFDLYLLFKISVVVLIFESIFLGILLSMLYQGTLIIPPPSWVPPEVYSDDKGGSRMVSRDAIWKAARAGQIAEVDRLLRHGVHVNARDPGNGWTALHYASAGAQTSIAQRLVNAGADIDAETRSGETPLGLAISYNATGVQNMLRNLGARDTHAV